ncbi:MAG: DNA-methyltransferase [Haloechinothrix sp.]
MTVLPHNRVLVGDAVARLGQLPDASVDCVVTSPPYFGLRDYEVDGQIGLESSVHEWVSRLLAVTGELARVLKPQGSLWLNVNDSFSRRQCEGAPTKAMLLAPERLLLALTEQGWMVRSKVVWAKPHPMPSPAKDRLTGAWEPIYFLVRSRRYWFDLDSIRIPHTSRPRRPSSLRGPEPRGPGRMRPARWAGPRAGDQSGLARQQALGVPGHPLGKNPANVWTVPQSSAKGIHHAVYPEQLIERPILATCPERVCVACGHPWQRERSPTNPRGVLRPGCSCGVTWQPGLVLDPFLGSGTTAVVAERLGRHWLGIELNPTFATVVKCRLLQEMQHLGRSRDGESPGERGC